jgi:hypothetical protein
MRVLWNPDGVFEWFDGTISVKYLLFRRIWLIEKHF